jgi:hypothetical protein
MLATVFSGGCVDKPASNGGNLILVPTNRPAPKSLIDRCKVLAADGLGQPPGDAGCDVRVFEAKISLAIGKFQPDRPCGEIVKIDYFAAFNRKSPAVRIVFRADTDSAENLKQIS